MNIILVGMNHKTAPLEIRERLALSCGEGPGPLMEIRRIPHVCEALYLSTCNRVEVLAGVKEGEDAEKSLKNFVFNHGNLSQEEMKACLYVYRNSEAVRHLFRVAASLDSLVMGEPQILGQVKDAYRLSVTYGTTGMMLNKILHHTFKVAKRIRTETGIAANAASVSYAAVELAKKIFGNLEGKTILLIGAGEMSELAARHLIGNGAERLLIANRTYARAVEMAAAFGSEAIPFDAIVEKLREVDIVISSTGATGYILTAEMITAAFKKRKNRLLFLIDIAVPRDIDPAAGRIENVYLYNIDDLQAIVDENMQNRSKEAEKAEAIIAEEISHHVDWLNSLEVVPTIVSLRHKLEGIVKLELERSGAWLKNLSEEDRKNIEILAAAIVNKILHGPTVGLKEESRYRTEKQYVAAVRRLFGLDETP
jgi:glutamyl-tRNA reductase